MHLATRRAPGLHFEPATDKELPSFTHCKLANSCIIGRMDRTAVSRRERAPAALRERHRQDVRSIIPTIYATLRTELPPVQGTGVIVLFHDRDSTRSYGACDLSGAACEPLERRTYALRTALAPLHEIHGWYDARHLEAPNVYIAFDLAKGHAWHGRSLEAVQSLDPLEHLDAVTLKAIPIPTTGEPPRLAMRAQPFGAELVPGLRSKVSDGEDCPDEAFLLHEDLLRLAVDSLDGAGSIDPLPVHINALWVFSRPIIMQRPDGSDRHVRAVWFRQGAMMWRIRTYTAGTSLHVKQVGDQVTGRKPFVPVWDATRPEQKVLAAIWALMSQGDVTDSQPARFAKAGPTPTGNHSFGDLTVVRVKAGTDHAAAYASRDSDGESLRPAWSVRGHWRRQPYPSLGTDEQGRVRTRPIWIASYTKGGEQRRAPEQKVISVYP